MALTGFGSFDLNKKCSAGCAGASPMPAIAASPAKMSPMSGLGVSPDGLGRMPRAVGSSDDDSPVLAKKISGSSVFDAVLGGAIGYAISPSKDKNVVYAGAGAAALGLMGWPGLLGLAVLGLMRKQEKK